MQQTVVESLSNREVNPQEAAMPEEEVLKNGKQRTKKHKTKKNNNKKPLRKQRKGRNRVAYVAGVSSSQTNDKPPAIPLPLTQYVTVITRRAIRKRPTDAAAASKPTTTTTSAPSTSQDHGDISLGMKLSVVSGKVIVQKLNALSDGRASPAQMVGVIQRGDVLLSIDNKSLVNLPIDLLMERLKPLSTPDASGAYQRELQLRLSAGEGLELLLKYEAAESRKVADTSAASEVFSLFPMVDHMSGLPSTTLMDNIHTHISPSSSNKPQDQHQEDKRRGSTLHQSHVMLVP